MRYNLSLPQKGIIDAGLHDLPLQPALLIDYLRGFYFNKGITKRIIVVKENEEDTDESAVKIELEFAWLNLQTAANDLPLLVPDTQIDSSTSENEAKRIKRSKIQKLSRWISTLRSFKLIRTHQHGNQLFFRLTELSSEILGSSEPSLIAENRNQCLRKTAIGDESGIKEEHYTKEQRVELARFATEISEHWNSCGKLKPISRFTAKRYRATRAMLNDPMFREYWKTGISKLHQSSFATGHNDRNWKADFDWFLNEDNFTKIIEGKYDDRKPAATTATESQYAAAF